MTEAQTFRVFVSSTFMDLEEERNTLRERVYPEVEAFCAERGARFQPIDLRWGVSEEASLDQQTLNICIGEIERCRQITSRPNFLVLLGNRYGWRALPPQIPEREFEWVLGRTEAEGERDLLERWYQRDENAAPAEYRLRPRAGGWSPAGHPRRDRTRDHEEWRREEDRAWCVAETRLREILTAAVRTIALPEERRRSYVASATDQEIRAGALRDGAPPGRVLCFLREIELRPGDPSSDDVGADDPLLTYVDPDQRPVQRLKAELRTGLEGEPREYRVRWDRRRRRPTTYHLDALAQDVTRALEGAIERELEHPTEPPGTPRRAPGMPSDGHLDAEGRAHRLFADERARFFVGRAEALDAIGSYLEAGDPYPLVVHGAGGTGKSALLARAVHVARKHGGAEIAFRFIGATPASTDGRDLLEGMCRELARRYGADEADVPADFERLSRDLRDRLCAARADRPLFMFVDSLDQLSADHGARQLAWLPATLPEYVRLIVSTRPADTLEPLRMRLEQQGRARDLVALGPLAPDHGDELLDMWLRDANRRLTGEQRAEILVAFERAGGNPLYLRLAFEEARRWIGGQEPERLDVGEPGAAESDRGAVAAIIERNTFARLASEHGEVLVSRALGYLAASRHGLSEDELVDLLSRDPDVYRWFLLGSRLAPLDFRERLRERLSEGDRTALRERAAECGGPGDEADEWLRQVRAGERAETELEELLVEVLPRGRGGGLRIPVVLWSRLYADLRPYLTDRGAEGATLIDFFHRELGDVARRRFLEARAPALHTRLAEYLRPEPGDEGPPDWERASLRALSELPYHLTEAGRWEDLKQTLTDFEFLEAKSSRVGVERLADAAGREVVTYGGVRQLQGDFDRALRSVSDRADREPPRVFVTAAELGEWIELRCPHCNTVHELDRRWLGREIRCPNQRCRGPLHLNDFVLDGPAKRARPYVNTK